jgi:hypothetical protein
MTCQFAAILKSRFLTFLGKNWHFLVKSWKYDLPVGGHFERPLLKFRK